MRRGRASGPSAGVSLVRGGAIGAEIRPRSRPPPTPRAMRAPLRRPLRLPSALVALVLLAACGTGGDGSSSDGASIGFHGTADSAASVPVAEIGSVAASAPVAPPAPPTMTRAMDRSMAKVGGAVREERLMLQPAPPPAPAAPATSTAQPTATPSMVIRTGHATLEVDSLEQAVAQVQTAAQRLGGWVASSSMAGGREESRSASLEVKVPAARFDELVRGLEPIGHVESVNVNAQDVGEEFVDVQARVSNARRLEERLVVLLATRTGRLEDVLAVERELARVREEIERYDGRLRFLQTRVAVSTLTVTVHEPAPIVGRVQGASPIAEAVRQAWRNFVSLVVLAIAASGVLVPLAIVAGAAYVLWRRWVQRRTPVPPHAGSVTE
jgi:hypothetical protein